MYLDIYRIAKNLKKNFFYNKDLFIVKTQVKTYAEVFSNHMVCNEVEIHHDKFFSIILVLRVSTPTGVSHNFNAARTQFRVMYQ